MQSPDPVSSARTLHTFFIASTLIISVGAFVTAVSIGSLRARVSLLELLALLAGASALLLAAVLRSRLPARESRHDSAEWWRVNLGKAVLLWGLLELPALLGALALFTTRGFVAFGLLSLVAVVGLLRLSPGRLIADS